MISVLVEQALSLTPVLPVYGRLRQEDHSESWGQAKRFSNTLSKNNGWRGGGGAMLIECRKLGMEAHCCHLSTQEVMKAIGSLIHNYSWFHSGLHK